MTKLTKKQEDKLYRKFKAKLKKEKEQQRKRDLAWQIRFEEEPRGNHSSRLGRTDPGHDNSEDRR